jgi:hypothetical protein
LRRRLGGLNAVLDRRRLRSRTAVSTENFDEQALRLIEPGLLFDE